VAYCLGITNVCPVKHNLYFGRFLNPGRKDPPDIDVDFAWDERDGVIQSVLDQYGPRAAMVSSHILFQPRMAVRETAKVFGLTDAEIGRVTRRLPWFWRIQNGDGTISWPT
jgi:error-prone DNA polymerase